MKDRAPERLTLEDLRKGHDAYVQNEPRDAMYRVASFLVKEFWNNPSDMADGLGVLLLTWNAGFYRYGSLDFEELQKCIKNNLSKINELHSKNITDLSDSDIQQILQIFNDFLTALRRPRHKKSPEAFSPVSVAKTLHVLAPEFFPLWDDKIAKAYGCYWYQNEKGAVKYWQFMLRMRDIAKSLDDTARQLKEISDRSVLKLIDEYNYSRFSNDWLQ